MPEKFGGFSLNRPEKFGGFFLEPIRKYIRTKGNGAEGAEDFWQDKFRAGKIWWVFLKLVRKNLVGIPSDEICPPKFFLGEIFPPLVFIFYLQTTAKS